MKFEKEERKRRRRRNRRRRVITGIICVVLVCICLSIYAFGKSEMLGSFAGGGLTLRQIVIATGSDAMETADSTTGETAEMALAVQALPELVESDIEEYRLGRMKAENSCKDYRILRYKGNTYSKLFSVYCGDKDAQMPWYGETLADGVHRRGTRAAVYSDDAADQYAHNGSMLNSNIRKALYQGYKEKKSQTVIQNLLNSIRHSDATISGTSPLTRAQAELMIGGKLPSPVVTNIAPTSAENRLKYTYNMSTTETAYVSDNTPEQKRKKRTEVIRVSGGTENGFSVKVPSGQGVTFWICVTWNDTVKDSKWKACTGGSTVRLKAGDRFLFTADIQTSGNTKIAKTAAEKYGFTTYAVVPDNKKIQSCFAGVLYEYTFAMTVDWGKSLTDGSFTVEKNPVNPAAVRLPSDEPYYNMAGIRYTVYSDKACTDKAGSNIVVSYDGKAYQDKDGANVVFDSEAARQHYITKYKYTPCIYYWTKLNLEKDSSYTYYYRERDTVYTGDGKARWYAAKGNTYGYLDANVYPYDTAGIVHTGYRVDSEVKSFTLKKNSTFQVDASVSEDMEKGKLRLIKTYFGDISQTKGVRFRLYKVPNDKTAYDAEGSSILIGEYMVNAQGKGIPVSLTSEAITLGIKSDYKGEDIDQSLCRDIYDLPLGWYVLVEDAVSATERGFRPAQAVYHEITTQSSEYEFQVHNSKINLSVNKTTDQLYAAHSSEYSFAGIRYRLYMADVTGGCSVEDARYAGEFEIQEDGKGKVTDINKGFAPTDGATIALTRKDEYTLDGLPAGIYYLVEISGNAYFEKNLTPQKVDMSLENRDSNDEGSYRYEITVADTAKTGELRLEKVSEAPEITDHDTRFSLEGAVYEVYMVTGKDQPYDERYKVGTFTTKLRQQTNNETLTAIGIPEILNSCGVENQFRMPDDSLVAISADQEECVFSGLPFGWYAVVEVKESEGFALDPVIYYKHLTPEHPEEKVRQTILSVETTTETTTEDTTETTTENTTETTTEDTTEDTTEITTENSTEVTTENSTEITTENSTEITTENTTEATTEDTEELTAELTTQTTEQIHESGTPKTGDQTSLLLIACIGAGAALLAAMILLICRNGNKKRK